MAFKRSAVRSRLSPPSIEEIEIATRSLRRTGRLLYQAVFAASSFPLRSSPNWNCSKSMLKTICTRYQEGAPISDDDAISELCGEASAAIVVTKSASDFGVHNTKSGKDMIRIPAFAFLYLLGHAEKNGYKGIE